MTGTGKGKRRATVILNGISLKKKLFYHEYLPALSEIFEVEVRETLSKNDAKGLASKFADRYVDMIIAAGGDGTVNQVVNGILKGREKEAKLPVVAVIPMGSGNDFARGAGLTCAVQDTLQKLSGFNPHAIDVGLIEFSVHPEDPREKGTAYFVNVADIGMGPEVVRQVLASGRPFGSAMAYYKSILNTFLKYRPTVVKAVTDDWTWEGKLRTLAVANGGYYGHGLCIAPDARMDDRNFSVFICGDVSMLDFILHSQSLKKGRKVRKDKVQYRKANTIELSSDGPCPIEGDGEILGWLPAKVTMIERQLDFLI